MSASPSNPPAMQRRKQPVSIFAPKRKLPVKRQPGQQRPTPPAQAPNGAPQQTGHANGVSTANQTPKDDDDEWTEYPIYVSRSNDSQSLHFHAMKLQGRVFKDGQHTFPDPYDQSQFVRPLQLHRRLGRDKIVQAGPSEPAPGIDDKERELMSIKREERQREREANQAQIAPTGSEAKKHTRQKPKKKVEDVYYDEKDEVKRKKHQTRYEESRPWHLEDFEHKNVWIGNYEEPPSEESVMFEISETGFRMVPIEKWYRFTQANRVKNTKEGDAIEKEMAKPGFMPRFLAKHHQNTPQARKEAMEKRKAEHRAQQRGGDEEEERPANKEEYNADVDEMDYEFNDEFQDDDEGAMFGDQELEDQKDVEQKMRAEMRNAGLGATGIKDEDKDYDAEEEKQREEEKAEKRMTKRLRKALMKKERKQEYEDESEHGEFSESSESEDSEEEQERLEQERKQEEARKANGDKSGASTRGTNTPNGRAEKRDPAKLGNSLKRPGSPDLSELSGNESSRKRARVNGAPAPNGSRALSPDTSSRPNRPPRSATGGGSGSGSETEASSNTREGRPKIRLRGSPDGSRAATPSRQPFPTLEEVRAAIPEDGIAITELVNMFRSRVLGRQGEFIPLVKSAGRQDPASKKILPKTQAEMQVQQQKAS